MVGKTSVNEYSQYHEPASFWLCMIGVVYPCYDNIAIAIWYFSIQMGFGQVFCHH